MTLHLDSISKDNNLERFWNLHSEAINSSLWLPHRAKYPKHNLDSYNKLLNYWEEKLCFWKNQKKRVNSSASLLLLSIPSTERVQSPESVITTKKIRIFPKDEYSFKQFLHVYRRSYNLSIDAFKKGFKPSSDLRRTITHQVKSESSCLFNVNLIQDAFRKACKTRNAVISKRTKGQKCDYSFMSWKYSPRSFSIGRLGKGGSIYKRVLGSITYTESIPVEAIGQQATIKLKNGEWYVNVKQILTIKTQKTEDCSIVSLDPGSRTFITAYNENQVISYGKGFVKNNLVPLITKLDKLISKRDKLESVKYKSQWVYDWLKNLYKRIDRARARRQHLIEDLHNRVAYDLVTNFDVILLPTFRTKSMANKETRRLGCKSVRQLLSVCHYKFKLKLNWMARKYGKTVYEVNEAYTSKTVLGEVQNIGSNKEVHKDGMIIDRDDNGARNILIRFLTNQYKSGTLSDPSSLHFGHNFKHYEMFETA